MKTGDRVRELDRQMSMIGRYFANARRGFRDSDMTGPQFFLLRTLRDEGPRTICRLADSMFLNQATVSNLVIPLDERGYVVKERDTSDRRLIRVAITSDGVTALEGIERDRFDRLENLLSGVNSGDLDEILRIMKVITSSLGSENPGEGV